LKYQTLNPEVSMSNSVSSAPTRRTGALSVAAGLLAAFVVAGVANAVVALLARAAGASTEFAPLNPSSYLPLTAIGLLLGSVGWAVIRRIAARPERLLRLLVPAVVVISLVPDLTQFSSPGGSALAVVALMVMHVVVATAGVLAYRRVLPLPAG
jgi:hypothetical protein